MNIKTIIISLFAVLLLASCGEDFYYSNVQEMEDGVWSYDRSFKSTFNSQDSTTLYQIWLDLEHDQDFDYQNIYIQIETIFPNGESVQDVLPLELKSDAGSWAGDCSGDRCNIRFNLIDKTAFQYIGEHTININQYGRKDDLGGVYALGLHMEVLGE